MSFLNKEKSEAPQKDTSKTKQEPSLLSQIAEDLIDIMKMFFDPKTYFPSPSTPAETKLISLEFYKLLNQIMEDMHKKQKLTPEFKKKMLSLLDTLEKLNHAQTLREVRSYKTTVVQLSKEIASEYRKAMND